MALADHVPGLGLILRDAAGAELCRDAVVLTVVELDVQWYHWAQTVSQRMPISEPNVPHLDDPGTPENEGNSAANVGLRVFPDATSPGGGWNKTVGVIVRTNPIVTGLPIYVRSFDVDDPSDNVAPVDGNDGLGPTGGDNRNTTVIDDGNAPGTLEPEDAMTGPQFTAAGIAFGVLYSEFTLPVQPGDNFRVAATMKASALNTLTTNIVASPPPQTPPFYTVPANNEQLPLFPGGISPLLTTWRRLNVEVDSMAAPDATNMQTGAIVQSLPLGQVNHWYVVLQPLDDDFEEIDHYWEGRIDISGFPSILTRATYLNVLNDANDAVVAITDADLTDANGLQYTLWDDDIGNTDGFFMPNFDTPPVDLPRPPNLGLMERVFGAAFVFPDTAPPSTYQADIVFDINVNNLEELDEIAGGEVISSQKYWAVQVLSAFQAERANDKDPDLEIQLLYGRASLASNGSLVFLEAIRDDRIGVITSMTTLEQVVTVHEIGHLFKLNHADGYWPPGDVSDPSGDFIMTDLRGSNSLPANFLFSPTSRHKIRALSFPGAP